MSKHPNLSSVVQRMEDRGCRVTAPRLAVLAAAADAGAQFTAEEIDQRLPHVGRATVFRTLKLLEQCGLAKHTDFTTEHSVESEEGRQRPDAIVRIPGGKMLVTTCLPATTLVM